MKSIKTACIILAIAVLFTSCSTMVRIETPDVPNASVKINGEPAGETPLEINLGDAIWEDYDVEIMKNGYQTYRGRLKKEVKIGSLVGGFFLFPFWLWVYGPEPYQNIYLEPEKEDNDQ
ncbi:MAG: PEGA domain-containing protein [Candidatus Marinimicrobia bacterium]|nr:PEGA domain-containing protein [Candidatus Neomarinimicrobiota bacterium]